jgi:hypothetical protein
MFRVTAYDCDRLVTDVSLGGNYNPFAFERYEEGHDVFEPMYPGWKFVYILGREYTDVIMFRHYVESQGEEYAVHMFANDCLWAVATNLDIPEITSYYR